MKKMIRNLNNTNFGAILAAELFRVANVPHTEERRANLFIIIQAIEDAGITNLHQIAYVLATVRHECSFLSIPEIRAARNTPVWRMQEKYWHTGFYGRGFCQLTWRDNYAKFSPIVGIDLVANPDEVLKPEVGAKILAIGMRDGMFSGKKLSDYITDRKVQFLQARRIVNGNFQADRVAEVANRIYAALF